MGTTKTAIESSREIHSPGGGVSAKKRDSTRYVRGEIARFPVGRGSQLVYSVANGAAKILPAQVAAWLESIQQFGTIAEHARGILAAVMHGQVGRRSAFSGAPTSGSRLGRLTRIFRQASASRAPRLPERALDAVLSPIADELRQLAQAELIIGEDSLFEAIRQHTPSNATAEPISTVGVITKDRVDCLERCLLSIVDNCRRHSRRPKLVVADDSANNPNLDLNRETLGRLSRRFNVRIDHIGREEKTEYLKALGRAGQFPQEILEFALGDPEQCGHSTGANRNWLLLQCSGEMCLSLDDDVTCLTARPAAQRAPLPSGPSGGIAFQSAGLAQEFYFFPDRESAIGAVASEDLDFLAIHEELLGRGIGTCAFAAADVVRIDPSFVRPLMCGEGRVLLTQNGAVGDSGMTSPLWLWLRGDSRERMVSPEGARALASGSREILRFAPHQTVTTDPWCMGMALGFDNRDLLPPFFPVLRTQDALFGSTLRACFPRGYIGHLPWAVLHSPPERRAVKAPPAGTSVNTFDIVVVCISSLIQSQEATDGPVRMRAFGKHLIEVGTLPQVEFEEFIRLRLWRQQSTIISQLEATVDHYGRRPAHWAADIDRHMHCLRQSLLGTDYIVPRDLTIDGSAAGALCKARRLVHLFGRTLEYWPDIVATAKALKMKGVVPRGKNEP